MCKKGANAKKQGAVCEEKCAREVVPAGEACSIIIGRLSTSREGRGKGSVTPASGRGSPLRTVRKNVPGERAANRSPERKLVDEMW